MKNLLFLGIVLLIFAGCSQNKSGYEVKINVKAKDGAKAYLMQVKSDDLVIVDSSIYNGGFVFNGNIETPEMFYFRFADSTKKYSFFIDNSKIDVSIPADFSNKIDVKGSKTNDVYNLYLDSARVFENQNRELYKSYGELIKAKDEDGLNKIRANADSLYEAEQKFSTGFVNAHTNSVVGLYVTLRKLIYTMDYKTLKTYLEKVPKNIYNSRYYKKLSEHLAKLELTKVGAKAQDFTLNDTTGKPVSLKDFKGNYTMIDFWASWCSPCRALNPKVLAIYNKYHAKGFNIIGVSLDQNRNAWINAIKHDMLAWTHVSDLKGWKNEVAKKYGINSIPHTFLLDKEGTIIGNNLTPEELDKKLESLLK